MPTYRVTDPNTGRTLRLTGDSPPTEQELEEIFTGVGGSNAANTINPDSGSLPVRGVPPVTAPGGLRKAASSQGIETSGKADGGAVGAFLEPAAALASSAVAEPVAGLAGIGAAIAGGAEEGAEAVKATRDALTYAPRTASGQKSMAAISGAVEPVAEAIQGAEQFLGDAGEEIGGPVGGAIGKTIPTAVMTGLGVKGMRGSKPGTRLSPDTAKAITQASPDLQTIKQAAKTAYQGLDDLGVRIRPLAYEKFANKLAAKLNKQGIDKTLHPKSTAALNRILDDIGQAKKPSEIETLRRIAGDAAKSIEKPDARLGSIIVDEIDDALDSIDLGKDFKNARALSQRAFKSQAVTDMIENASHTASGLENGLRIEARKLLKNKKRRRGFTADEIAALKKIEQGTTAANTAKFLGKFGISEGQATSMLGASIGIGGGGAIGSAFGPAGAGIGALTVPALGQMAKKTAQRITLNNTKFADDLFRAGKSAREIAKAYIKNTPIKERSISDLTDLFMRTDIGADDVARLSTSKGPAGKLISDAGFFASEIKRKAKKAASAGMVANPPISGEQ